jgi:hypothetical protein
MNPIDLGLTTEQPYVGFSIMIKLQLGAPPSSGNDALIATFDGPTYIINLFAVY